MARRTIDTPAGPRTIPDWAKCYCVSRHTPNYIHPLPWSMPDGMEIWICPNSHHQATALWRIYNKLDGPPKFEVANQFNFFTNQLCKLSWQQKLREEAEANIGLEQVEEIENDYQAQAKFLEIKRAIG